MIALTIIIGATALIAGHLAGITETRLGTGAITALILFFAISALPQCHWLFDNTAGWATIVALWGVATALYHRILTDGRRSTPTVNHRAAAVGRRLIIWQFGRQRLAVAYTWSIA